MSELKLFSIIESPLHPDFSALYKRLNIEESKFSSMRRAIAALKTQTPDLVVAEFMYGYGNNYAGVNVCNLLQPGCIPLQPAKIFHQQSHYRAGGKTRVPARGEARCTVPVACCFTVPGT
jgi:hypothetical protein